MVKRGKQYQEFMNNEVYNIADHFKKVSKQAYKWNSHMERLEKRIEKGEKVCLYNVKVPESI